VTEGVALDFVSHKIIKDDLDVSFSGWTCMGITVVLCFKVGLNQANDFPKGEY
jgi:hypothetical protein